ncbi:signal peptide peptidase SppA [bacterium]|nr:MAG: signal peptide peptidase SppA [bacterium]
MIIKNILAAIGAFFVIIIALVIVLVLFKSGRSDKVVVVRLDGVITDSAEISEKLRELRDEDDVKAVVIRIDSPGGAVGPSQEIYSEIKRLSKTKKVVASLGALAASGGYYAAVAANKIVANPGTLTGSIGVIVQFINAEGLLSKVGIKGHTVKSGAFKDVGSPFREIKPEETAYMQAVINDVNNQFIKAVAEGRGMKTEDVEKLADGRVFTGAEAKTKGLVDSLGDLTDAVELGAKLAGITGKPHVIYPEKKGLGVLKTVFGESVSEGVFGLFSGARIMYMAP